MITVMGATGHTGKKITEALLNAGEKVRALGRSESKLAELKWAGAEALIGDATLIHGRPSDYRVVKVHGN
jgi:uncharacterized protein YbjT (DUF2867 family)